SELQQPGRSCRGSELSYLIPPEPVSPDRFPGPHYANEMIGEGCMRPLQLISRHVTRHALLLTDRTYLSHFFSYSAELWIGGVAGATLRVIKSGLPYEVFMGIVAGGAAHTLVAQIVAFAVGQAVGLEAHAVHSQLLAVAAHGLLHKHNLFPGAVTRAAKTRHLFGFKDAWIENVLVLQLAGGHGGDMPFAGTMARFAVHARDQPLGPQFRTGGGSHRMAAKTLPGIASAELVPRSLLDSCRDIVISSDR